MAQKTGQIKRKMQDRGFGFIQSGSKEFFFHTSQCSTPFDELEIGDNVTFTIEDSAKGPRAVNVERT